MKFAIIGYGKMGKLYDKLLGASYIVDPIPIANRVNFGHIDEFISYKQPVDLVIVSTPIHTHFEIVRKLLVNGYNVLCEKPICLSFLMSKELEQLAEQKRLILYQSALERYNPLVKFIGRNINVSQIVNIESCRYGLRPSKYFSCDPKFDLGIHDVDLWFYLVNKQVPWHLKVGYDQPKREILVNLQGGGTIKADLMNKYIVYNGSTLDFANCSSNNPLLEMVLDLMYKNVDMNEPWSAEIEYLEKASGHNFTLTS